jgi:predicted nucleic acid-binding protein
MAEFWNACTRPLERNGFGLSIAEAAEGARELEEILTLLPENAAVYREWRRLVVAYRVSGVKVHDARLVAVLRAYRIRHLLTFNEADFRRYEEVVVVRPESVAG